MSQEPRVRLRDVTLADADMLDGWSADPALGGEFNDFGLSPRPIDREALKRGPLRNERNGQLIVERVADGEPIGTVGWHKVGYGPNPESDAWNVGIELLPDARGQGFGGEAQAQLAGLLFAETAANRVEAQTDIENVAEQRSLEKAGFRREGVARGSQFRAGSFHDLVTFARLRDDQG
jgi:RimJ/RimL family protein N-acetyltransferase